MKVLFFSLLLLPVLVGLSPFYLPLLPALLLWAVTHAAYLRGFSLLCAAFYHALRLWRQLTTSGVAPRRSAR